MRTCSTNHPIVIITYSVVLFGSVCSPAREIPMRHEQSVRAQEQATRSGG
jgi:hypothetical protein